MTLIVDLVCLLSKEGLIQDAIAACEVSSLTSFVSGCFRHSHRPIPLCWMCRFRPDLATQPCRLPFLPCLRVTHSSHHLSNECIQLVLLLHRSFHICPEETLLSNGSTPAKAGNPLFVASMAAAIPCGEFTSLLISLTNGTIKSQSLGVCVRQTGCLDHLRDIFFTASVRIVLQSTCSPVPA